MSTVQTAPSVTVSFPDLETLIRRVIREEMRNALAEWLDYEPTIIEPGSPLDDDLTELLERKQAGTIKLYSYAEVWGSDDELPA